MLLPRHRPGRQWLRVGVTATSAVAAALFGTTAAHAATDTSPPLPAANPQSLVAADCDYNGASNQWMTRSDAVTRARSWVGWAANNENLSPI